MTTGISRFRMLFFCILFTLLFVSLTFEGGQRTAAAERDAGGTERPNIIVILADDLGYGDMTTYNPRSKISTPNIDALARNGMKFTDAHAAAAWCTPSRFGLLTGRYPMDRDMDWTRGSLITRDLTTIASVLKTAGYATACVGKWHLGFDNVGDWRGFDYSRDIRGGPVDKGFDYFFGIHASLDIGPYFFICNRQTVEAPTDSTPGHESDYITLPNRRQEQHQFLGTGSAIGTVQGAMWRTGKIAPHFDFEKVTPALTDSVLAVIERNAHAENRRPFFIYYAMTGPHTPWVPLKEFQGRSGAGPYGDFVMEMDYEVGRIVRKLKDLHLDDNTMVVFASDNGPVWFTRDVERYHHRATFIYRGMKADAWEGGHRVPLIVDWPGKVPAESFNEDLVSYTDLFATLARVAGAALNRGTLRDSYDLLPLLTRTGPDRRTLMVEQAETVREGSWKLIFGSGMGNLHGDYGDEDYASFRRIPFELYDLATDPWEKVSVYDLYPSKVDSLKALMNRLKAEEFRDEKR
jgi:arylsulfatase A